MPLNITELKQNAIDAALRGAICSRFTRIIEIAKSGENGGSEESSIGHIRGNLLEIDQLLEELYRK